MTDYQLLPPLSAEEYAALKADIAARGVLVPVEVDEQGNLLDGHHRVRAWEELRAEGVAVAAYPATLRAGLSEPDKLAHVLALNLARRHLDRETRGQLVAALQARTGWSIRRIAEETGLNRETVRRDLLPPDTDVSGNGQRPTPQPAPPRDPPIPPPASGQGDGEDEWPVPHAAWARTDDAPPPTVAGADPPTPEERAMSEYLRLLGLVRINRHPPELIAHQLTPRSADIDAGRVRELIEWLRRLEAALRKPTLKAVREADA